MKAPAGAQFVKRPQERQTIPPGNVSGGRKLGALVGQNASRRVSTRQAGVPAHVSGADYQQLSGCFLESGDAASTGACRPKRRQSISIPLIIGAAPDSE